jgi:hypothetical protein
VVRLIREEGVRPALVIGMPVGFVSAAESKDLLMTSTIPVGRDPRPQGRLDAGRRRDSRAARPSPRAAANAAERRWGRQPSGKVRKGDGRRARGNRTGFTTGACAAAAARAATLGLLTGVVPDSVLCRLPNGREVTASPSSTAASMATAERCAHAVIVKDAGDDPDATHGAHMTADVRLLPRRAGEIELLGGPGVGTVTKRWLGLAVGGPAINPVPRRNIRDNVRAVGGELLAHDGLIVTISVPGGEEMAKKTLNARLGILGGISILGTTGIVRPYSTAAFRASVVQAVDVAANRVRPASSSPPAGAPRSLPCASCRNSTRPASCRWATSSRPLSRARSSTRCARSTSARWSAS